MKRAAAAIGKRCRAKHESKEVMAEIRVYCFVAQSCGETSVVVQKSP
jgi:hypothetical protein